MPECAKTHLQQSRISKCSGGGPPDPPLQREGRKGKGGEEREEKGKGRREGGIGEGGEGREGTRKGRREGMGGGGEGRGGALDMGSAPPPP